MSPLEPGTAPPEHHCKPSLPVPERFITPPLGGPSISHISNPISDSTTGQRGSNTILIIPRGGPDHRSASSKRPLQLQTVAGSTTEWEFGHSCLQHSDPRSRDSPRACTKDRRGKQTGGPGLIHTTPGVTVPKTEAGQ